jgi:hypothetical protein
MTDNANMSNSLSAKTSPSTASRVFSREEQVAIKALEAYAPEAIRINPWKTIPNFLDATLILIEFYEGKYEANLHRDHCVLVREKNGEVFEKWPDVMSLVPNHKPSFITRISSPAVVLAIVTLAIVATSCAVFFINKDVPEPFRAALGTVCGYWLGQAAPLRTAG